MKIIQFCRILNINLKNLPFISFSILDFNEILIKLRSIFNPLKTIYWQLFRHYPTIHIIYFPIIKIWRFLSWSFIYLLLVFADLLIEWYIPPLIPFQLLIAYQYQLIILILLQSFFKTASQTNPETEINFVESNR